jgi:ferredoxin
MVKDEDVCLHCGLCAERCPTGAWDMQKYLIEMAKRGASHARPMSRRRVNDFVVKFANVNGSGRPPPTSCSPVRSCAWACRSPAQHLPLEHPGPADLVRGARHRGGHLGARGAAST